MRIIFVLIFLACGLLLANDMSQKLPLTNQLQKDILPWFVARDKNDSQPFSRKNLENIIKPQTKKVALVFFASWCIPCREGIVLLRDNEAELEKNGVMVVLVNTGENDLSKMENWVKINGSEKWPVIIDKFKNLQKSTGLISGAEIEIVLPKTILLDNNLKPVLLIGVEGADWPAVLWE